MHLYLGYVFFFLVVQFDMCAHKTVELRQFSTTHSVPTRPGMSWKMTIVLKCPGNVLEFKSVLECPGKLDLSWKSVLEKPSQSLFLTDQITISVIDNLVQFAL